MNVPPPANRPPARVAAVLVAVVLLSGFGLRLFLSTQAALNGDEAMHFLQAQADDLGQVYKQSKEGAHPPLYFLLLHLWLTLGNSEVVLRLLSVLLGTAAAGMFSLWLARAVGKSEARFGLILFTFSPAMIGISIEVRQYALLLLGMSSALYCYERAFADKSRRWMLGFSACLALAIVSNYEALWFTIAIGVCALWRLVGEKSFSALRGTWLVGQLAAAALYAILYVTHISKLHGGGMQKGAVDDWLRPSFFHAGEAPWQFVVRSTRSVFTWFFVSESTGLIALFLFGLGVTWLLVGRRTPLGRVRRIDLALLFVLPFALGCAGAMRGLYPYGGTRHVSFLFPFALAGVAVGAGALVRHRARFLLPVAAAFVVICLAVHGPVGQYAGPPTPTAAVMPDAMRQLTAIVPDETDLFVDHDSSFVLRYYLLREQPAQWRRFSSKSNRGDDVEVTDCGPYRLVSAYRTWRFTRDNVHPTLSRMAAVLHRKPTDTNWVVLLGAGRDQLRPSADSTDRFHVLGPGIAVSTFRAAGPREP